MRPFAAFVTLIRPALIAFETALRLTPRIRAYSAAEIITTRHCAGANRDSPHPVRQWKFSRYHHPREGLFNGNTDVVEVIRNLMQTQQRQTDLIASLLSGQDRMVAQISSMQRHDRVRETLLLSMLRALRSEQPKLADRLLHDVEPRLHELFDKHEDAEILADLSCHIAAVLTLLR